MGATDVGNAPRVRVTGYARSWIGDHNRFLAFEPADASAWASAQDPLQALTRALTEVAEEDQTAGSEEVGYDVIIRVRDEVWFRVLTGSSTSRARVGWLGRIAERLTSYGYSGKLNRPHRISPGDAILAAGGESRWPSLTLNFAAPVGRHPRDGHRPILADTVRQLLTLFPTPATELTLKGGGLAFPCTYQAAPELMRDIANQGVASAISAADPSDVVRFSLVRGPRASVTRCSAEPWPVRVEEMVAAIRVFADQLTIAYVRTSHRGPTPVQAEDPDTFPSEHTLAYFNAPWMWDEYVFDAQGVQLVSDNVLAKARDLTAWHVEQPAPGRNLVRARDLTPWYSGQDVDPDVIAQARRDFGNMLPTRKSLEDVKKQRIADATASQHNRSVN